MKRKSSQWVTEFLKEVEGMRLDAYQDSVGVWTIGIGHTRTAKPGMKITEAQALALLWEDLKDAEDCVNALRLPLYQNQFDALVSFVFNLGCGAFRSSTLLSAIRKNIHGDWYENINGEKVNAIQKQFERWVYAGGKVLPGLVTRRQREAARYLEHTNKVPKLKALAETTKVPKNKEAS